ncbi:NADPH-dependent FMN reductase [Boudabousia marimammalium]|uniref:NAD(P)H-dependent oxidoreductase n=1 Tax=Boudabousia marimammalium TaxID=156892 RepID=A0A1Q5PJ50_9ACTO|nr:NADPH-dependent FMN reductase [Boudabousia marimammalium]OKL45879.1 NAD(P)H-dependent oxidoreductase [Boudabousia marimammalium]
MAKKITVLVGSLRRASVARKIAKHAIELFPEGYEAEIVEIRDLPLYDFDYDDPAVTDKPTPEEYTKFREIIKASDGVLFVTPENNRTIPACLKNAVDICSKPNSDVAWKGLPAGIISHSIGKMGGYSSHKNLKLALSYFAMPMVLQPEVFIGNSHDLIGEDDRINNESTIEFIRGYIADFCQVVEANPRH